MTAPVSVIIPCYRCTKTIGRALDSVARQTVRPLEVIMVDDASNNGTLNVLYDLQRQFGTDWIQVIALPANGGAGMARNAGWDAARGTFVAFLDADDAWHPQKIEIQHGFMVAHPEAVLSAHRSRRLAYGADVAQENVLSPGHQRITKRQLLIANRFITPAVMLRRDLPYRFRRGQRHMEDHLLWLEIACDGHLLLKMKATLAYMFKAPFGESGLSSELWRMEMAELTNYRMLQSTRRLGTPAMLLLWCWSLLKFLRRLLAAAVGLPARNPQ